MTVQLSQVELAALSERARRRQLTVDRVVLEAVHFYLNLDEDLLDELTAWQEVRDEALALVEGEIK